MFTGIIEETGKILELAPGRLKIRAKKALEGTKTGDSIAVNGVCLTVTDIGGNDFTADVMPETLSRSFWQVKAWRRRQSGTGDGRGRKVWGPYRIRTY